MQGFKLFLTLGLVSVLLSALSVQAADEPSANAPPAAIPIETKPADIPPPSKERISGYIHSGEGLKAPAWDGPPKNQFIGYAWPFTDRDVTKELSGAPVVLEMFTTQGCVFCPTADKFFDDLLEKVPTIIGLACHVDYLDVAKGSLSMRECTARQTAYSQTIPNGNVYSPQIVVDGQVESFGFDFEAVYRNLKSQLSTPPLFLPVSKGADDVYTFELPDLKAEKGSDVQLEVLKYRLPVSLTVSDGVNQGAAMNYKRSVSSIAAHSVSGHKESVQETITKGKDDAGAVVLLRSNGIVKAVAEIKFP